MTNVRNIETGEIVELSVLSDGTDFLSDVIGGTGDCDMSLDADADWDMTTEQLEWWTRWAGREQRILDAANERGERAIDMICSLAGKYGHDMELLQDMEEKYLKLPKWR